MSSEETTKRTSVMKDEKLENFTIRLPDIKGFFRCQCGCNVFHKPDDTNLNLFKCNGCGVEYSSE